MFADGEVLESHLSLEGVSILTLLAVAGHSRAASRTRGVGSTRSGGARWFDLLVRLLVLAQRLSEVERGQMVPSLTRLHTAHVVVVDGR